MRYTIDGPVRGRVPSPTGMVTNNTQEVQMHSSAHATTYKAAAQNKRQHSQPGVPCATPCKKQAP